MENNFDVVILGSANCDFFFEVEDFPQEGETIQAKKSFILNGGKGANQAVAVSKLLGKSLFLGQFGKDSKGESLEHEMKSAGVNLDYVRKIDDESTGHAFIMLNNKRQNMIIIVGGANMAYSDLKVLPKEFQDGILKGKFLMLQREVPNEINVLAAKFAKEHGKKVILDYGGRDDPFPIELLDYLDFISPNETEIERLAAAFGKKEDDNFDFIREVLLKKYPELVILLKLGSRGSRVFFKDIDIEVTTVNKINPKISEDYPILDTTGAGDCFTGAFVTRYLELVNDDITKDKEKYTEAFKQCCIFGSACAYLTISKKGAMPAMPLRKTVNEFMEKYLK